MTDVAEMSEAQTSHFVDKNRVCRPSPTLPSLAWDIDDGDVFDAGANRVPGLPKRDASQDYRIAGHSTCIVVGEMVIADGHGIRLDPRSHVEVWIRDDLGLAAGMNQKT